MHNWHNMCNNFIKFVCTIFWNWLRYRLCQIKLICVNFRNRYKSETLASFSALFCSKKKIFLKYLIYDYRSYLKPPFNTAGRQTAGMCEEVSLSCNLVNTNTMKPVIDMSSVYTSNINIGTLFMFGLYRIPFYSGCCLDRFHCRWNIGKTKN